MSSDFRLLGFISHFIFSLLTDEIALSRGEYIDLSLSFPVLVADFVSVRPIRIGLLVLLSFSSLSLSLLHVLVAFVFL